MNHMRIAILTLLFLLLASVAPRASAVNLAPNPEQTGAAAEECAKTGSCLESYSFIQSAVKMNNTTCIITGCSSNPQSAFYYGKSALATVNTAIIAMYTHPQADFGLAIHDMGQSLGFIPKTAYAQGIGFSGLSGLLPLWKVFRNIAYFLLAVVMIVIGFMVMLRKKIDPKTVVTVQNALPKIVITLLLITFSYAIVGLMIDAMYLIIFLLVGIFQSTKLLPDPSGIIKLAHNNATLYSQGNILTNIANTFGTIIIPGSPGGNSNPLKLIYQALGLDPNVAGITSLVSLPLGIGLAVGTPLGPWGLLAALPAALSVVLGLLLSIALLFLIIRLFIFFLGSYIQIIFALIFAPIQIAFEALPGSTAFADWFKNLFANLIVFPIGAGAFMLSSIFANMANDANAHLWSPPLAVLVPSNTRSISALIAIGILFAIPSIAGGIKEALKSKPALPVGFGAIAQPLAQAGGIGFQVFQFFHAMEQTALLKKAYGGGEKHSK